MTADELSVRLGNVVAATLVRFDDDRILLAFDRAYIDDNDRPTLSLAFNDEHGGIVTDQHPTRRRAPAYFANLLAVRPRGHLPNDRAATKLIYLALRGVERKWRAPPTFWHAARIEFAIHFGERFAMVAS